MVGVAENNLRTDHAQVVGIESLDRSRGPDRHEDRSLYLAVGSSQLACASATGVGGECECKSHGVGI